MPRLTRSTIHVAAITVAQSNNAAWQSRTGENPSTIAHSTVDDLLVAIGAAARLK